MTDREFKQGIDALYKYFEGDETTKKRIDADLGLMVDYIEVREYHIELSHAPAGEYDRQAVAAADQTRTTAHNEAIKASLDLNDLCAQAGLEPIAPVPAEGVDPYGSHRHKVASFAYQVIRSLVGLAFPMATPDDVVRLVQYGARRGAAACQSILGSLYESGMDLPQDVEQALTWYHRAASQGDADALFALGRMTVEALGEPDGEMDEEILAHAFGLIRAAADAGNMQAHVYLSRLCDECD